VHVVGSYYIPNARGGCPYNHTDRNDTFMGKQILWIVMTTTDGSVLSHLEDGHDPNMSIKKLTM
jgi:hypothetical protein